MRRGMHPCASLSWLLLVSCLLQTPVLRSSASLVHALSAQGPQEPHEDPLIDHDQSSQNFQDNGGSEIVHQIWSHLRDTEQPWRETVIDSRPSGVVGTIWYYTKIILKTLFMNAPANTPASQDGETLSNPLQQAVDTLKASAALEDPDALFLLGEMNLHGNYSHPRNPQAAFEWYSQLADVNGNSTAQYLLGFLYATGLEGAPRDQAKAMLYHNFAADQGNVRSEMTLAFRHHSGIGTSRDCNKAVHYYKRVADKAMSYWQSGPPGGRSLPRNSYRWVEAMGGAYGEGASASSSGPNAKEGVVVTNIDDMLEYLSMRESSGDYGASFQLGKHYYDPPRGYRRNLRKAQRQFMKIARAYWTNKGDVNPKAPKNIEKAAGKAAAYIGRMFLRGEGMEQNFEKAITWFRRGITLGDPFAQFHLGIMYKNGYGLPRDGNRAASYLKAAAEQGLAISQSAIGVLFLDQGDIETAGRYFELAAASGVMEALYYLAELTNNGIGRDRNCGLASVYYKVVAERAESLHSSFAEANAAYEHGDLERAFIPTLMAAEQGYEHAQANVAYLLDQKVTVISLKNIPLLKTSAPAWAEKSKLLSNPELALVYYTRSAKQANVDSLVKMGDYYLLGYTTPSSTVPEEPDPQPSQPAGASDLDKATTCYVSAAEGHHSAQALWNLGWLHENGVGSVTQDFHMAKRYYDLALEMNKEAYLPVKLALMKLRFRSWWNGVSGGKVNPIRDEENESTRPKTFWEWVNRFLDNFEEAEAAEAVRQNGQGEGGENMELFGEPGMPGGDTEYAAGKRRENDAGIYGDEWEEFDDGLVESLIIIALAGALALLVYARQQHQRGRNQAQNQRNVGAGGWPPPPAQDGPQVLRQGQGQDQQGQPPWDPVVVDQNAAAGDDQQQHQQQERQQPPGPGQDGGFFPPPDDPNFNTWVAGGVGH